MKNFSKYLKEDDNRKIEKLKATMVSVLKKNKVKFKEIDVWDYGPPKGAEFLITISNGAVITYTPKDDLVRIPKNANPDMKKMRAYLASLPGEQKIADVKLGKNYIIGGLENALKML